MATLLRLTHLVTLVVLPPAFATLAAHAARSIGGGEARCAAELDLPTPGFICAAGLDLLFSALVFTSFHLVIALPLAWWAATRRLSATRLLVQLTLVLVLLGTPMLWLRVGRAGLVQSLWETYAELGFPLLLALLAAITLAKYVVWPDREEHSPRKAL